MKGTFVMLIRKMESQVLMFGYHCVTGDSLLTSIICLSCLYITAPPGCLKPQTQVGQEYTLGLGDVLLLKGG